MGKSFKIPWFQSPPTSSEVYFSGLCKFPLIQLQLLGPDLWQRTRHIIHAALQILRTRQSSAVSTEIPSDWINKKTAHQFIQCEAPKISKLVNITPITMVYGTYNELVTGAYKPTYNWGASHCREKTWQNRTWNSYAAWHNLDSKELNLCIYIYIKTYIYIYTTPIYCCNTVQLPYTTILEYNLACILFT